MELVSIGSIEEEFHGETSVSGILRDLRTTAGTPAPRTGT